MISINAGFNSRVVKMTDRPVIATCLLGDSNQGTGLPVGIHATCPAPLSLSVLSVSERNERPTKAPDAAVAAAQAQAYAFAAAGAGVRKQTTQQNMWAFRGLEPWSDPA